MDSNHGTIYLIHKTYCDENNILSSITCMKYIIFHIVMKIRIQSLLLLLLIMRDGDTSKDINSPQAVWSKSRQPRHEFHGLGIT